MNPKIPQTPDVQMIKTSIMIAVIKTDSESITVELMPRLEKLYSRVPTWLLQLLRDSILKIRIIFTPLWMWKRLKRIYKHISSLLRQPKLKR